MTSIDKIRSYIGEILVILGSGLFTYNVFNWSYIKSGLRMSDVVIYYYDDFTHIGITMGIILIVTGIFVIKNKKI